ncbi:hypothetical protein PV341_23080, partial [Streptomyces sp. PA03-1a]|nr:hypothetical protein [Streptomyces sp. PA03-1a]
MSIWLRGAGLTAAAALAVLGPGAAGGTAYAHDPPGPPGPPVVRFLPDGTVRVETGGGAVRVETRGGETRARVTHGGDTVDARTGSGGSSATVRRRHCPAYESTVNARTDSGGSRGSVSWRHPCGPAPRPT